MGVNLMIAVHNHQPVGNFPWVFEGAFDRSYGPFLEVLKKYPDIRITLHNSGPLIDWMEQNRPEYLDAVRELSASGQIEIMGGGYYEPILSIIPEADAAAQIEQMNSFIGQRFGKAPRGIWMTERVWEPTLPVITDRAGIDYTLLDDTHFRYAGLTGDDLFGYFVTEYAGHTLSVFPIDRHLRYTIPFREPQETLSRLQEIARVKPGAGVVYGDDGEKFGLWPGTYQFVYEEGWLVRFFEMVLENRNWITLLTFSEYLDRFPPTGRVYLPTASYEEMAEWALPADAIVKYREVRRHLTDAGMIDEAKPFIRGGFFANFLSKYRESNNMHKRMLFVSGKVNAAPEGRREAAMPHLLSAQCNCAYWHGLFGGLYLNYLRHAIYQNLCAAQRIVEEGNGPRFDRLDFDADGYEEILVSTPGLHAGISPAVGGSLFHLDLVDYDFCLSNTMSRVFEAYHAEAMRASSTSDEGEHPESIHDRMVIKEAGLMDLLTYDRAPRYSFMDHLFCAPAAIGDLIGSRYDEAGDFVTGAYGVTETTRNEDGIRIALFREGSIVVDSKRIPLGIKKIYTIGDGSPSVTVRYTLANRGQDQCSFFFGVEGNYTLLAGDDPGRYLLFSGGERRAMNLSGEADAVEAFSIVDEFSGFRVLFRQSRTSRLIHYGVQTASNSEGGLERTYQGTCIVSLFPVALPPGGEYEVQIGMIASPVGEK
jgi:4-alpha-glucanotransferase